MLRQDYLCLSEERLLVHLVQLYNYIMYLPGVLETTSLVHPKFLYDVSVKELFEILEIRLCSESLIECVDLQLFVFTESIVDLIQLLYILGVVNQFD